MPVTVGACRRYCWWPKATAWAAGQTYSRPVGALVTKALAQYRARRCPDDLAEGKRAGRPRVAPGLSARRLAELLDSDPLALGYAAASWTVPLLAAHLRRGGEADGLSARTLRRRLHAVGLAWKRPRYVFGQKEPHRAQKKGPSGGG
jgi:hypothetical protein